MARFFKGGNTVDLQHQPHREEKPKMAQEGSHSRRPWLGLFSSKTAGGEESPSVDEQEKATRSTWNMGMLNDKETIEVPGKQFYLQ